jgi:hypothetical protein
LFPGIVVVALSLEVAQTLALGPFNPYIITPEWLVKTQVCEDQEVEIQFTPISQGVAFSFEEVKWQIDFRTLLVASRTKNCGELVARVLERLHHTPVRAVGNNFHYACGMEHWGDSPLPMLGAKGRDALGQFGTVDQTRWAGVLFRDKVRVEVTVAQSEAGVAVLFNFHRDTKDSAEAQAAAHCFDTDKQASRELLEGLFHQKVGS